MAIPADEGCIDPQQLVGRSQLTIGRAMVDSLVYQNGKDFEPWLAKSWEIGENAKVFTFQLRDDVTFSDGTKLDAQTVVDNFNAIVKIGSKARLASTYLTGMTGAEAVDGLTVRVTFGQPNAAFMQAVSSPSLGILSAASTATLQDARCLGKFTASGPLVLDKYTTNQSLSLTKRKGYAWAPISLHQGDAYLDAVNVSIVGESGVRAGTLISGQNDYITEIQRADIGTLESARMHIESQSNPGLAQGLWINPVGPVLSDPAVRKALQVGINRDELINATLSKYQVKATSVLSSRTPGYVDHGNKLDFDPEAAEKSLEEAGWVVGSDGIRKKDGQRLTVTLLYGSQLYGFLVPHMELMQQQLQKIGFDLVLRPLPDADANMAWIKKDFQLRISALTRSDPDALRTALTGTDKSLDALLTKQISIGETAQRMDVVAQAQDLIIKNSLYIPISELALPMAHSDKLGGVVYTADSLVLLSELQLNK